MQACIEHMGCMGFCACRSRCARVGTHGGQAAVGAGACVCARVCALSRLGLLFVQEEVRASARAAEGASVLL